MSELTHSCPACGQKYDQADEIKRLNERIAKLEVDQGAYEEHMSDLWGYDKNGERYAEITETELNKTVERIAELEAANEGYEELIRAFALEQGQFLKNEIAHLERIAKLEDALVEIANSGVGVHSAWGWLAPFAHKALQEVETDE